jgi:hypothetical protein
MKRLFQTTMLVLAIASAAIAATAGAASASTATSIGTVAFTNSGWGSCQYFKDATGTHDNLTSPAIKVYGLGATADYVRLSSRLVTTGGSAVTNWSWAGDKLASSTSPAVYNPVTWYAMNGARNVQIQFEADWYRDGTFTGGIWFNVTLYNVYAGFDTWTSSYCTVA